MKGRFFAVLVLVISTLSIAADTPRASALPGPIPELATKDGTRYTNVTITNLSGERLRLQHDEGVITVMLTELDDKSIDQVAPGYRAEKIAREQAQRQILVEQQRRIEEDRHSIETQFHEQIAEALRVPGPRAEPIEPLVCIFVSGRDTYKFGEFPQFVVRIVNRSAKDVYLIRSLDGSSVPRRFPHNLFEVSDAHGNAVEPDDGMCFNMNMLRETDFVRVRPGEAFNPFGMASPIFNFSSSHPLQGSFTVRFHYSTNSRTLRDYFGDERLFTGLTGKEYPVQPEIRQHFDEVTHVDLKSKILKITFAPNPNN